jgi:hypothetical protein
MEVGQGGVDWIAVVQVREKWRALSNVPINIGVPEMLENYAMAIELLASGVVLSSRELPSLVNYLHS